MSEDNYSYENEEQGTAKAPKQAEVKKGTDVGFEEPGLSFKKLIKEWIIPAAVEIAVVLLLFKYVFFFVIVPTGSMIPTIQEHSFLFATRVANPERSLQRGDIVVFDSDELGKLLVKRLIGLPGETVSINASGSITIDGVQIDEPYVKNQGSPPCEFQVPEGRYLFLGDNRSGSYDARGWEQPYITADKIAGEARFTLWPFSNFGLLN